MSHPDFAGNDEKMDQLRRQIIDLKGENDRLRGECTNLVDKYERKLDAQQDRIAKLNIELHERVPGETDVEVMLRRENDTMRQENSMLRERVAQMSADLNKMSHAAPTATLEAECRRLRADLQDREREVQR